MSYTPEPWRISKSGRVIEAIVKPGEVLGIATFHDIDYYTDNTGETLESNAARIVAAVNAVAGIPTEELVQLGLGGLAKLYAGLNPVAYRECVEALKSALTRLEVETEPDGTLHPTVKAEVQQVRQALTHAEA